ncbi:MAG: polymerase subunit sigma-24 [Acidobacteria bacterium]|nr:polymerase subunit sigma-24 [Acidobacteriota bacterium]
MKLQWVRQTLVCRNGTRDFLRESATNFSLSDQGYREHFLANSFEEASDLELARLARAGDESAFAEIMRRYSPRVFRIANRFFRQRSLVEEAAQEIFLKAFSELGSYEGRGSMEGWLTRMATNTCLNLIRSAKRRPELTVSDLTEDESAWLDNKLADAASERHQSSERSLVAADLAGRVFQRLAPDDQLVLTMIDGEEASVKDVAELTGWSESKVKVTAFRARRRMRQAVEKLLGLGIRGRGKGPVGAGS